MKLRFRGDGGGMLIFVRTVADNDYAISIYDITNLQNPRLRIRFRNEQPDSHVWIDARGKAGRMETRYEQTMEYNPILLTDVPTYRPRTWTIRGGAGKDLDVIVLDAAAKEFVTSAWATKMEGRIYDIRTEAKIRMAQGLYAKNLPASVGITWGENSPEETAPRRRFDVLVRAGFLGKGRGRLRFLDWTSIIYDPRTHESGIRTEETS